MNPVSAIWSDPILGLSTVHVGECRCSQPDEEFHHRIILNCISTSNEGVDVLAIRNNSLLVYSDFNVGELTSEMIESNRTETILEEIAPHWTLFG